MKTNYEKNLPIIKIGNVPKKKIVVVTRRGQRSKETVLPKVRGIEDRSKGVGGIKRIGGGKGSFGQRRGYTTELQCNVQMFLPGTGCKVGLPINK